MKEDFFPKIYPCATLFWSPLIARFFIQKVCKPCTLLTYQFVRTFQFDDIGKHGTKVVIYNLWLNDEGIYELSFDDDVEVCCLSSLIYNFSFAYRFFRKCIFRFHYWLRKIFKYILVCMSWNYRVWVGKEEKKESRFSIRLY